MKKYTLKEINEMLRKALPKIANFFDYLINLRAIKLDGTFLSEELHKIADIMEEVSEYDNEITRIRNLKVKKFVAKDIKVRWFKVAGEIKYSFYIMKNGKDWDFYYGQSDQGAGSWWPEAKDEFYLSPIHRFIPKGFNEWCENVYEFSGTHQEALALFKDCGFTVEQGGDI